MESVAGRGRTGKKTRVLGEPAVVSAEEFAAMEVDAKVELIQALIPVGLMAVSGALEAEVTALAGEHCRRTAQRLHQELRQVGRPVDIVVATPAILEKHKDNIGLIYRTILEQGREIYAI